MSFVLLQTTRNEIDATLIKGKLESDGIKSMVSSINNNSPLNGTWLTAQDIPYGVYVEEAKVEEAKKFLAQKE